MNQPGGNQPGGKDSERNEIYMDAEDMYREDSFTDNAVGTLRRLTPVTANGDPDASRPAQYIGTTQIMTNAGPLPLSFQIPADTMAEAIAGFGAAAKIAFENTMNELRELQRQQSSSIVIPRGGIGGGPGGQGGMGGPGFGGRGGIQIP